MDPLLWGPVYWNFLFSSAHTSTDDDTVRLMEMIEMLSLVLPCEKCREHFPVNLRSAKAAMNKRIATRDDVFSLLWRVKAEVNKSTKRRSVSLEYIRQRYEICGTFVNDLQLAEILMCTALVSSDNGSMAAFSDFCTKVGAFLPQCVLQRHLRASTATQLTLAKMLVTANSVRTFYGLPPRTVAVYRSMLSM